MKSMHCPSSILHINKLMLALVLIATLGIFKIVSNKLKPSDISDQLNRVPISGTPDFPCSSSKPSSCNGDSSSRKSIFYIKVHKTGSTTLRSTLLNYGRTYNLTICMDSTDMWGLNWPYTIDNIRLTKLHDEKCGVVAEELVYDRNLVRQLMSEDVFIMASVRHPVQHFLSLFKYARIHTLVEKLLQKKLSKHEAMRIFLKNPTLIQNTVAALPQSQMRDRLQINMIRPNLQMFSLGIKEYDVEQIKKIAGEIDFFVVTEMYNESMIILREKLCCKIEDVLYRKQNRRRSTSEQEEQLPEDISRAIFDFNKGDLLLYMIALERLNCDILGHTDMKQSLELLKHELQKYDEKCRNIKEGKRFEVCPPTHNGQVGVFVENIRKEQRKKLTRKLRDKASQLA